MRRWRAVPTSSTSWRARPVMERVDLLLAPVLVVWLALQVALDQDLSHRPLSGAVGALLCAGVAVRRRWPVVIGFGTQLLLTLVSNSLHLPAGPVTVAWFCALYALAVWTTTRWFVVALVLVVLANGGLEVLHPAHSIGAQFGFFAAVVMLLVRLAVGGRDRQLRLAEREREVAAREAVVEERERIARELHDVIGHHVSTMVVQAGAERRMLPPEQDETREVLGTIERLGRSALDEMRRMVAMLRRSPEGELSPQPRLADLPVLVEQLRAAGVPVSLVVDGDPRSLPDAIELSAYRIVQEALTNTVKHAGGSPARVRVGYRPDALELEVTDAGSLPGAGAGPSGGHGLVGMRERVQLYGGTMSAGPQAQGGFAVHVSLPVR